MGCAWPRDEGLELDPEWVVVYDVPPTFPPPLPLTTPEGLLPKKRERGDVAIGSDALNGWAVGDKPD